MANGIDWFRWHHGSVNDPKFGLVAKKAGARLGDVITVWALVLELASANQDRGQVDDIDHETTDFLLGADDGTTARILEAMEGRGLLANGRVVRWDTRQPKREREDNTAAERKRQQRERDSAKGGDVDGVTPSHAMSHQDTPREEKSREEKKEAKSKAESAPATRLPADWRPEPEDLDFCKRERPDLNPQQTADGFRDYWLAVPGVKGKKANWPATWRNWVRNQRGQVQPRASPQTPYQARQANTQTLIDRISGKKRHEPDPDPCIIDLNERPA